MSFAVMPFIQCITCVSPALGRPKRVDAIMNLSLFEIGMPTALSSDSPEVVLTVARGSRRVATTAAGGSGVDSCRRGRAPSFYMRVRIDAITIQSAFRRGERSYHFTFLKLGFYLVVQPSVCKQVGVAVSKHVVRMI